MKLMKFGVYSLIAIVVVLTIFSYPFDFILEHRLKDIGYKNIIKAADQFKSSKKTSKELIELKFEDHRISEDSLYIKLESFFVSETGVFVLFKNSKFMPLKSLEPSFKKIQDRIYWYEIKG